jgi:DNA-binding NtrC family response regulator
MKPDSKRLLFVDDERGIRETLPVILGHCGFTVTVAANVSEALEHIRQQQFDVLLCDLNIEGERDGFQIVRAIRAIDPDCVAVMLTAYPDMESAIQGIRHGVDDYIIRPANPDDLVASLADTLAKRRAKEPRFRLLT